MHKLDLEIVRKALDLDPTVTHVRDYLALYDAFGGAPFCVTDAKPHIKGLSRQAISKRLRDLCGAGLAKRQPTDPKKASRGRPVYFYVLIEL